LSWGACVIVLSSVREITLDGHHPAPGVTASEDITALALRQSRDGATDHDSNGSVDRGLWQINSVHGHWSVGTYQFNPYWVS